MDRLTREIIEDVANLVALQVARPIEIRLAILETKLQCSTNKRTGLLSRRWKIAGLCLAAPGWILAILSIIRLF
jgi:hypothetical protein